jgi:hypothetical protein
MPGIVYKQDQCRMNSNCNYFTLHQFVNCHFFALKTLAAAEDPLADHLAQKQVLSSSPPHFMMVKSQKIPSGYVKIAIENDHLQWIFPLNLVIFHSYVKLPDGTGKPHKNRRT